MSEDAKNQEQSSQQRLKEKGSILNYFTKKDASTGKPKLQLNSAKDSKLQKVEETDTKSTEAKHEHSEPDLSAKIDEIQPEAEEKQEHSKPDLSATIDKIEPKDEMQPTVDSKEESGSLEVGTPLSKEGELEVKPTKTIDSFFKRSEDDKGKFTSRMDNSSKHKNVFAFMMANRDKQNEVIKKMAEEDEVAMKLQECDNKSERHSNSSVQDIAEVCTKNGQVDVFAEELKDTKDKQKLATSKDIKSPLKRKKSPNKKSTSQKDKEGYNVKVSKTSLDEIVTLNDDDDFVCLDQNKSVQRVDEDFVHVSEVSGKNKEKIDYFSPKSRADSEEEEDNAVLCVRQSPKNNESSCVDCGIGVNDNIKDDKLNGSFNHLRTSSESSIDKGFGEQEVPQISLQNASSDTKAETAPAVIGNAFTLMMTNRHKMNKQSAIKKDESTDDDTCSEDLNYDKAKKKRVKKLNENQAGKRGRKRKKSSSCDLDSSLNDFEDILGKKKKSKWRRVMIDSESSSADEDNENDEVEIKFETSCMINTSCAEIEIVGNSKKLTSKNQADVMSVFSDEDISSCDKSENTRDHDVDKNKIGIVKADDYLTQETKEFVIEKECSNISSHAKDPNSYSGEEKDCKSSDELVISLESTGVSENQTEKSIVEVDEHSKVDVPDTDHVQCEKAKKEELNSGTDSKKLDVLEKDVDSTRIVGGSNSDEDDATPKLRGVRKLRKTKSSKSVITNKRIMAEENEIDKSTRNLEHKNSELVSGEACSGVLDGPPKKRRKRINKKSEDENIDNCNDEKLVEANDEADEEKLKDDNSPVTKKGNISTFFKKMSKEEKEVERNKNVITVKVDVHAPCEGSFSIKESKASAPVRASGNISRGKEGPHLRRSSRRLKKELEDFDKIELLEQIQINSPKKLLTHENIRKDSKNTKKISIGLNENSGMKAHPVDSSEEEKKSDKSNESKENSKSEESSVTISRIKLPKGNEVAGMGQDKSVRQISVSGVAKLDGKRKKVVKKKVQGKKEQPKLTVNKIKETQSSRKMSTGKLLQKRKINHKKQGAVDMSKRKGGEREPTASPTQQVFKDINNRPETVAENEQSSNFNDSVGPDSEKLASSSCDEIFVKKKGKKSFLSCAVPDSAEMVNDDKENMEDVTCRAGKMSRATKSSAMLKEGSSFNSFDEWNSYLERLRADGYDFIRIRDSKLIKALAKKSGRIIKPSLKYSYVVYKCHSNYSTKNRKLMKESQQKSENECPWKLKIMPSPDGKTLFIKEICLEHNHPVENVEKEECMATGFGEDDSGTLKSETQTLSTPANKIIQLKTPTGSKKKKSPTISKVVTGRKTLKSQDNLRNQIHGKIKASKANGKKKSPKVKKKGISADILALQDDAIKKMAEKDSKVCMAVDDIIDISEDSPTNKTAKVISKKTKIPPLILKPPPKEQKPMKIKKGAIMKKNHDVKRKKLKKSKIMQLTEASKCISSRPSRQAAIKVKKMFKEMSSDEDSDTSDIEISLADSTEKESVSGSRSKGSTSKQCKNKEVKTGKKGLKDSGRKEEKLAPIFCKRPKSPEIEILKTTLSPSKLKARQDFLQSGVPEQIRKLQLLEKSQEEQLLSAAPFPEFNHVQQKELEDPIWNLEYPKTLLLKDEADDSLPKYSCTGKLIHHEELISPVTLLESNSFVAKECLLDLNSVAVILKSLKRNNPKFPVYTFFKLYFDLRKEAVESYKREVAKDCFSVTDVEEETKLSNKQKRRSKERLARKGRKKKSNANTSRSEEVQVTEEIVHPSSIWPERIPSIWTQVYAPKKGSHVIGNKSHVKKLKGWLKDWKNKSEAFALKERNKKLKSSKKDDDFIVSEGSSDEDDDFVSTYLLCGPPGVGKTAVVYALATELGYNVLEVNASSKRPGKHVTTQLAEATQSHSVSNSSNQATNAIAALFAAKNSIQSKTAKNKADTEEESQGCGRDVDKKKGLSVVLFEDIDIVFEESDEGFLSTVNNLMTTTKRPIILTVSYPSHCALSKIKGNYERLDFEPPPDGLIAQHLQLICLVNGQHICLDDIEKLVSVNKCDIRQSLLDVQVWSNSGSSSEKCSCLLNVSMGDMEELNSEAVSLHEIFSDKIDTESKQVETYRKKLWGKVHSRYIADGKEHRSDDNKLVYSRVLSKDMVSVSWNQIAASLPFFLPYPIKAEKKTKKYPLQADDPSVKTTYLWQKYNWLSIDEDEDESVPPTVVGKEEVVETKLKTEVPQYVLDSSKNCVSSTAKFYDAVAELDVLDSHYLSSQPDVDNRNANWWKKAPTPGLSDLESHYKYWEPYTLIPCIAEEIGQRAFKCCFNETKQFLEDMPSRDWKQVSLSIQENDKPVLLESQLNADEWSSKEMKKIDETVITHVPLVQQLSRKGHMDYLYFVRSVIRHDELSSVVSQSRRGRRVLSQTSQYGIDISKGDKIKLANSLCL